MKIYWSQICYKKNITFEFDCLHEKDQFFKVLLKIKLQIQFAEVIYYENLLFIIN